MKELLTTAPEGPGVGVTLRTFPGGYYELVTWDNKDPTRKRGGRRKSDKRDQQDPEVIESATRRAKRVIRHKCMTISADRMFTLTTRADIHDVNMFWVMFKKFLRKVNEKFQFQYVAVAERHKKGDIHIHFVTNKFLPVLYLRACWLHVLKEFNTDGAVNVRKNKNRLQWNPAKLAAYIAKYIGKETVAEFGKNRYRTSINIKIEQVVHYLSYGLSIHYLAQIFEEITGKPDMTRFEYEYNCYYLASWSNDI